MRRVGDALYSLCVIRRYTVYILRRVCCIETQLWSKRR